MNEFRKAVNLFNKYIKSSVRNNKKSQNITSQNQLTEKENINERSFIITGILKNYRDQQKTRNDYKESVKRVFVPAFSIIAVLFVVLMIVAVVLAFIFLQNRKMEFLSAIIGSLVTGFSAVISILLIITHYIFPTDEEKNFNELISTIVTNDTKRLEQIANELDKELKNSQLKEEKEVVTDIKDDTTPKDE